MGWEIKITLFVIAGPPYIWAAQLAISGQIDILISFTLLQLL